MTCYIYCIYQLLVGFVLGKEGVFFVFEKYIKKDLTFELLRFASPYFRTPNINK